MKTSFLKNLKPQKQTIPWDYFMVDDFLPSSQFQRVQKKLCSVDSGYSKRDDDRFDLNFMFVPDLDLAKMFLSDEFQKFLENTTKEKLEIYEKSLVQLRLMTPQSPAFEAHVDDQDERSLVCLWYLSPNWSKEKGGELNLLSNKESSPADSTSKIIAPLANRMVFFFTDDTNWHSVNKVSDWNRYSIITEWIVK